METLKLLYENIFANIQLTYAMCGQCISGITLLDLEESLPVPTLFKITSQWKNPFDAYSTIVTAIDDMGNIDELLDCRKTRKKFFKFKNYYLEELE